MTMYQGRKEYSEYNILGQIKNSNEEKIEINHR
jgi:hypothetical protein